MKYIIKLYLYFLLVNNICFGQIEELKFHHINIEDGLSNNVVYSIIHDDYGLMWFGTDNGLTRWDGHNFKVFRNDPENLNSLSHNRVFKVFEDQDSNLWICTSSGINRYNRYSETFTRYSFNDSGKYDLHADLISWIIEDNPRYLWIGTHLGLVHFNKITGSYKRYIPSPEEKEFSLNSNNTISWITKGKENELIIKTVLGIIKFKTEKHVFEIISFPYEVIINSNLLPIAYSNKLYKDRSGNIWLQLINGKLYQFNIYTEKFTLLEYLYKVTDIDFNDQIMSIEKDVSGLIWIGTINKGLYCIDWNNGKSVNYKTALNDNYSISSNLVNNIYTEKNGNIWLATYNEGINKVVFPPKNIKIYQNDPSDKNGIQGGDYMDFCEDDEGNLWIASLIKGLSKLNLETDEVDLIPLNGAETKGVNDQRISSLLKDRSGSIWIGKLGLDKYIQDQNSFIHYTHNPNDTNSISNSWVISLLEDNHGNIWCGLKGEGLDVLNPQTNSFKHYKYSPENQNSLSNNIVNSILQLDDGNFLIGTENGLNRFDGKNFTRYTNSIKDPESISSNFCYDIFKDSKKRIWVGTERGLNLINLEKGNFKNFSEIDLIYENQIWGILEDEYSNLLLRTRLGFIRFNPDTKKLNLFNEKNGLEYCRSLVYGHRAFLKGKNGKIYYGTSKNIIVFHPNSLDLNLKPPEVIFTKFILDYHPVEISKNGIIKKSVNYLKKIELDHSQNIISIEFNALDYSNPAKVLYAYKLEGLNNDWIYCGNNRSASYTNLYPGNYRFKVKASYEGNNWSSPSKSIRIIISPPWWATWWFRSIAIITLLIIGYLIYKYRVNQLLALERMRVQIASDLHDDVGSSLTKIAIHSEIIKNTDDKKRITNSSAKIGNMSREIISSLSDIIWSIDARNDRVGDLIDRMRDYLESVFPAEKVTTDFQARGIIFEHSISQDLRQNIYLIFKEAVNNASKHSDATEVQIRMTNGNGKFKLEIRDNGKGIELDNQRSHSHGLQNMKLRTERIGGKLELENENGTKITLIVKEL